MNLTSQKQEMQSSGECSGTIRELKDGSWGGKVAKYKSCSWPPCKPVRRRALQPAGPGPRFRGTGWDTAIHRPVGPPWPEYLPIGITVAIGLGIRGASYKRGMKNC